MSKTSSDPYTSSNCSLAAGKSHEETYAAIQQKLSRRREMSLVRAPSMPPCFESNPMGKGSDGGRRKSKAETPSSGDLAEESQDEEVEFSMGRLIRQASLKSSDSMHIKKHPAEGVTTSSSRMKVEYDRRKLERLRPRRVLKTQKSSSDLVWDELKSFKDLGFNQTRLGPEQDSAPPPSPEEDMKAQIKFWARAVASNCTKNAD